MKSLTIWPEWCFAMIHLGKRIENRVWRPSDEMIGQRFALHAGAHIGGRKGQVATRTGIRDVKMMASEAGWSCILKSKSIDFFKGTCWCAEMYWGSDHKSESSGSSKPIIKGAIVGTAILDKVTFGDKPPWGVLGQYHWHLKDLIVFPEPIKAVGKQKLWNLGEEQEAEVILQQKKGSE
jgi:hypothetical protein